MALYTAWVDWMNRKQRTRTSLERISSRLDFSTWREDRKIKRSRDASVCFCDETYYCLFVKRTEVTEAEIQWFISESRNAPKGSLTTHEGSQKKVKLGKIRIEDVQVRFNHWKANLSDREGGFQGNGVCSVCLCVSPTLAFVKWQLLGLSSKGTLVLISVENLMRLC